MILILLVLLRAIIGPTIIDRLISINAITSKVSIIILLMAFAREEYGFVDVAFVFMLCAFVGGLWILKVVTPGDWQLRIPGLKGFEGDGFEGSKLGADKLEGGRLKADKLEGSGFKCDEHEEERLEMEDLEGDKLKGDGEEGNLLD